MLSRVALIFYAIVLTYTVVLWLVDSYLLSIRWFLWILAYIIPVAVFYLTMVAISVVRDRQYGKPVFCRSCGEIHDNRDKCPFCGSPRID